MRTRNATERIRAVSCARVGREGLRLPSRAAFGRRERIGIVRRQVGVIGRRSNAGKEEAALERMANRWKQDGQSEWEQHPDEERAW
jgi:hypothetical protein